MQLDKLKPCRNSHAVKEASLTVFLDETLKDFGSFETIFNKEPTEIFSRFELIHSKSFGVKVAPKNSELVESELIVTGFKFVEYQDGLPKRVFQGKNEENRSYVSFHEFEYIRWQQFSDYYQKCFKALHAVGNFNAKAFGLHYLDEFRWEDSSVIPYGKIFRSSNPLVPKYFIDSESVDFLMTRKLNNINNVGPTERIQIKGLNMGNPHHNKLVLSHNLSVGVEKEDVSALISSSGFVEKVNKLHNSNKRLLKEIFTNEVLDKITFNG